MIIYSVQPVSASVEPNTLTAHETDTAAALTAITPQRRSDRGDMVLVQAYQVTAEYSNVMLSNGKGEVAKTTEITRCVDTNGGYAGQQGGTLVYTNTGHGWWNDDDGTASSVRGAGNKLETVLTYHVDKERGLPNDEGIAVREVEVSGTLTADGDPAEKNDRGLRIVTPESHGMVRRLTVTECERLQFLPDGWTIVTAEEVAYEKAWAAKPLAERP